LMLNRCHKCSAKLPKLASLWEDLRQQYVPLLIIPASAYALDSHK
jgi:hypothetical protein